MPFDRRTLLSAGAVTAGLAAAGPRAEAQTIAAGPAPLAARDGEDQTAELQAAINDAAARGRPLRLGAGTFRTGPLELRPQSHLTGEARLTTLAFTGGASFLSARAASGIRIERLALDGARLAIDAHRATGLITLNACDDVLLADLVVRSGLLNGIALASSSGTVRDCTISQMGEAGIVSLDARGLTISHNAILDCANNGIQIWRSAPGHDGSVVTANRIAKIAAKSGGSGQNGNGINVFRAGGVLVSANSIADCAFSAIRGNAAGNIQMIGNACRTLGEVALYAEFGFEGALIASNTVDGAASGIVTTNFNEGGRLALVQGNLIRNLFRRENEAVDKRGIGISVEADAAVTGNVIESAPTAGIMAGWGPYLRDVAITGNVIRAAEVGILVTSDPDAGGCLVAQNLISGARKGAIRTMDHGKPHGPDLASATSASSGRIALSGNIAF